MRMTKNKSERGNALLEFAIGFSLLWALFAGIYQFGYSFYVYNVVLTSTGNAAQLGSKMTYDMGKPDQFTTALTNMVVYGTTTPASGAAPVVPGLSSANVSVSINPKDSVPTDITLTINNFTIDAVFTKFTFNGKPRATAVYMGQITCSNC